MLTQVSSDTHEEVYRVEDAQSGLIGFIAIHSTARGPAAGGLRMRVYDSEAAALADVLNLSRGMSWKCAAAGLPLGGGKAVILGDPRRDKTPAMLRAMGRAVEALDGRYWTAEDMGMGTEDMAEIAHETGFVAGLGEGEHASGDPSPVTARGVFNAMRIGARHRFGSDDLEGRRVAVQGLGHVGWALCQLLHRAGAHLTVTDTDSVLLSAAVRAFGAQMAPHRHIHTAAADIFAPCAIGGVLNPTSIPAISAGLVAGAANNQLATPADAETLNARGILCLPDYLANAGGIINVAAEILRIPDPQGWVETRLAALAASTEEILAQAASERIAPLRVADRIFGERLQRRAG